MKVWLRFLSSKMRVDPDPQNGSRILGPYSLGFLGPAIRRDDTVHPQVFHKLAVVIKAMSDRIHCERKARLLPLTRAASPPDRPPGCTRNASAEEP